MSAGEVVLLVVDNALCRVAARSLAGRFLDLKIIVEEPVSRLALVRGRIKRFGLAHTAGQLAFILFSRILRSAAAGRIAEIIAAAGLEPRWPNGAERIDVSSVNAPDAIARLRQLRPKVVLVVGTRIISRTALSSVEAPFINYHDGITPKYRGIHGGYWAKAQGDLANFGVTVHLVDPGIDTGAVLYQVRLKPSAQDNYATFPYLQIIAALPLLNKPPRTRSQERRRPSRSTCRRCCGRTRRGGATSPPGSSAAPGDRSRSLVVDVARTSEATAAETRMSLRSSGLRVYSSGAVEARATSAAKSAGSRAVSDRYRAGADGRSSGSDPRSFPSTGRSSRRCGRPRTAP